MFRVFHLSSRGMGLVAWVGGTGKHGNQTREPSCNLYLMLTERIHQKSFGSGRMLNPKFDGKELQSHFKAMDADGSKRVDKKEFVAYGLKVYDDDDDDHQFELTLRLLMDGKDWVKAEAAGKNKTDSTYPDNGKLSLFEACTVGSAAAVERLLKVRHLFSFLVTLATICCSLTPAFVVLLWFYSCRTLRRRLVNSTFPKRLLCTLRPSAGTRSALTSC